MHSFVRSLSLHLHLSIYLFDDADDEDDGFFSSILFFLLRVFANTYYLYRFSLITKLAATDELFSFLPPFLFFPFFFFLFFFGSSLTTFSSFLYVRGCLAY